MSDRQDGVTPEERLQVAHAQKKAAAAHRPVVERVVKRLAKHLEDNHFVDRLYEQLDSSRRHP